MAEIVIMVDETWVCLGTVSDGNWPGKGEMNRKERKHLGCLRDPSSLLCRSIEWRQSFDYLSLRDSSARVRAEKKLETYY